MDFSKLSQNVQKGNARMTNKLVQEALENGVEASVILEKGLIPALNEVGIKFKNNEIYVPEMLLAGKAMSAGIKVLEPLFNWCKTNRNSSYRYCKRWYSWYW